MFETNFALVLSTKLFIYVYTWGHQTAFILRIQSSSGNANLATRRHILQDLILHEHRGRSFKFCFYVVPFMLFEFP
jgi:hypothetical protein